ncbi:hypothetical protein AK812_SmicGene41343 [Symbiodinium microadriaticum]|uniref:Uncharacterized protein n=1 Tax=Symbiodinium microadriaticum TaxID=2951 RepID=A0A1Q9C6C5_SYMMI|nr:hypothetical protein AK812_SmicGene41343 [Symbiodinium microadriaticum]CAE7656581.1 unnamed protein product [Symbiodinium microadriaticum]CAE7895546.1 unnamed protein product [Symbiodinium sp. KB8]
MTFVRSQRKHQSLQTARLWAADRRRLKVVSKLKKYLIELGSYSPKNVVASYKSCKVVVRDNAKLLPIANINEDLSVNWLHNGIELQPVQVALEEFIADMELAGSMLVRWIMGENLQLLNRMLNELGMIIAFQSALTTDVCIDWKALRKCQTTPQHSSTMPAVDAFAEMLADLFSGANVEVTKPDILQERPFTMAELDSAIGNLKSNKVCDERGLAAELLHHAPPAFREVLLDFFNHILATGDVPSSWQRTKFKMLAKST